LSRQVVATWTLALEMYFKPFLIGNKAVTGIAATEFVFSLMKLGTL
jgi:hypothetical protein